VQRKHVRGATNGTDIFRSLFFHKPLAFSQALKIYTDLRVLQALAFTGDSDLGEKSELNLRWFSRRKHPFTSSFDKFSFVIWESLNRYLDFSDYEKWTAVLRACRI